MKKILTVILACLTLTVIAAGCSSATGKLDKIQKNGELVVYTDPNFKPFEFQGTGEVVGVDIEIAKAIAEELGVKVSFSEADFDSILLSLKSGKGDIAISGFTILPDRLENVDFSKPYIESVQYLILPAGSDITVIEDLAGKRVGVALGYSGQFLMEAETSVDDDGVEGILYQKNTELKDYNSAMEATLDMQSGRIDAVVMDEYVAKSIADKDPGLETKELRYQDGSLATEEYGVAVPKNNKDLLDVVNRVVERLMSENKISDWVVQFSQ